MHSPNQLLPEVTDSKLLANAYRECSRITHHHSKTFYLASALLPYQKTHCSPRAIRILSGDGRHRGFGGFGSRTAGYVGKLAGNRYVSFSALLITRSQLPGLMLGDATVYLADTPNNLLTVYAETSPNSAIKLSKTWQGIPMGSHQQ
jgi:hypothetical protein